MHGQLLKRLHCANTAGSGACEPHATFYIIVHRSCYISPLSRLLAPSLRKALSWHALHRAAGRYATCTGRQKAHIVVHAPCPPDQTPTSDGCAQVTRLTICPGLRCLSSAHEYGRAPVSAIIKDDCICVLPLQLQKPPKQHHSAYWCCAHMLQYWVRYRRAGAHL
jgi:hypothetical protein